MRDARVHGPSRREHGQRRLSLRAGALVVSAAVAVGGLVASAGLAGCDASQSARHPRAARGNTAEMVELRIDGMPEERPGASLGPSSPTLDRVLEAIDSVVSRRDQNGLFLRIAPLGRSSARADELIAALARVRAAHEPVHCHFETADNASYYVMAKACDRIAITPAGHLALLGVAAHLYSVRGLLDWAGVRLDMVQAGSAKGAADPFTRDEPTPEHLENVTRLVADLNARLAEAVAARIRVAPGPHETSPIGVFARGPFTSARALTAGLVDAVEFDDAARETARRAASARRVTRVSLNDESPSTITALLARISSAEPSSAPEAPHLVVAHLSGSIIDGDRNAGGSTASDPFVAAMREFTTNPNVRAVVLRIDSPGGSALASDRMWHAVSRLARRKPVVVSIGDMAASGGYYVACAGTELFAAESSIVGSIGVVAGRPDLSALLARLGIRMHPIVSAPSADFMMPFRPLRDDERARFAASANEAYSRFLARISASRPIEPDALARAAEGRVWTGTEARRLGLVDRLGTSRDAIARARALGHLDANAPVQTWPPRPSLIEAILGGEHASASASLPLDALDPALARLVLEASLALEGPAIPRTAIPWVLDIR